MRSLPLGLVCIALAAGSWAGCGGCGGCGGKPEVTKPAAQQQVQVQKPAPRPEAAKREIVTPSRIRQNPRQHVPRQQRDQAQGQSSSIAKQPQVTRQEIDADPRLSNPSLPLASKRTLKILEKAQKNNPSVTKPDAWYTGGKDDSN